MRSTSKSDRGQGSECAGARVALVIFPGTNCDHDVEFVCGALLGAEVWSVWHRADSLNNKSGLKPDAVILPGGFSYGDYLRTGALAKVSPILRQVRQFAEAGGKVLGICNGFQILCEAGLLPGVLLQNIQRRFLSRFVHIRVEGTGRFEGEGSAISSNLPPSTVITCPIAHMEGNYFLETEDLQRIEDRGQVLFRYCDSAGVVDESSLDSNPNGSRHAIAGVCNEGRNVVGLMPHPERSADELVGGLGGDTGRNVFLSLLTKR